MAEERTLVIVKPGNFERAKEIFSCLEAILAESGDFTRTEPALVCPSMEVAEKHNSHLRELAGEEIYGATLQAFLRSKIAVAVYSGGDIIKRVRDAIGDKDPVRAREGSVRRTFSNDSLEIAAREKRYLNNVIHASATKDEAEQEIVLWGYQKNKVPPHPKGCGLIGTCF